MKRIIALTFAISILYALHCIAAGTDTQFIIDAAPGGSDLCDSVACDDGNICTHDSCFNGVCIFDSILNCINPCDTLNCDDVISCTIDTCINGSCLNIPIIINLGNIEGPPCVAINTTDTYSIDSLGPDYLYQWQISGIGEFADSIESHWETMVVWNDTGTATLEALVFNRTCSDTAWLNIIVVEDADCCPAQCPPAAINEIAGIIDLKITPNPNDGDFTVHMQGILSGKIQVTLFNILGQDIYEAYDDLAGEEYTHSIQLNGAAKGVYLLQIKAGEETLHQLILIGD